jgi:hypothetical protein
MISPDTLRSLDLQDSGFPEGGSFYFPPALGKANRSARCQGGVPALAGNYLDSTSAAIGYNEKRRKNKSRTN